MGRKVSTKPLVCPRCAGPLVRGAYQPALSRTDNDTLVCVSCGTNEAMEVWFGMLTPQALWPTQRVQVGR